MRHISRMISAGALATASVLAFGSQRPLYEASIAYGPPGQFISGGNPPPAINWIGVQYGNALYYVKDLVDGQPVEGFREISWTGYDWAMSGNAQTYNNTLPSYHDGWAERQQDWFTVTFHNPFLRLRATVEVRYFVYTNAEVGATSSWSNTWAYAYSKFRWTAAGRQLDVREAEIAIGSNEMASSTSTTGGWIRVATEEYYIDQPPSTSTGSLAPLGMRGYYEATAVTSSGAYNGPAVRVSSTASSSGKARVTAAITSVETAS